MFVQKANNLSDLTSASTARTNLGLGTAATTASTAYATAAQGTTADTALQPAAIGVSVQAYDTDLAAFALKTAPSGAVVGTTDTQTLTNKTLTAPTVDRITDSQGGVLAPISSVMRNRIINGAMVIDQRNAGASVTQTTSAPYTLDRFYCFGSQNSKFTVQQNAGSVTPPVGFINYLGATSSSAYTVGSSEQFNIAQSIEGLNVTDLAWGTANAKTVTLSFQVYSSLTGTFGGSLRNSATNYSYPFSYTISSANTWTSISITITGATSGTWLTTNGVGIYVNFSMGAGSTLSGTAGSWSANNYTSATGATSVVGTSGATFYITGVQLEIGAQATGFEYRQYTTEFALCQRYFQIAPITYGAAISSTTLGTCYNYPVAMRTDPSLALLTTTPYAEISLTTGFTASGATISGYTHARGSDFRVTGFSGMTTGRAPMLLAHSQVSVSAEL